MPHSISCLADHPECPCNNCACDVGGSMCCDDVRHIRSCSSITPCEPFEKEET